MILKLLPLLLLTGCEPGADLPSGEDGGTTAETTTKTTTTEEESATEDDEENEEDAATGPSFFLEAIPGSHQYGPNGTWWGFNQRKIARYGDNVYTYVIENDGVTGADDQEIAQATLRVYIKEGLDGTWTAGAGFPTSRPGNLVVDSQGRLHVFAIDVTDLSASNNDGPLRHYTFVDAASGNITDYTEGVAVSYDPSVDFNSTANIRFGASVGPDDTLAVGFGLYGGSEELHYRPTGGSWTRLVAAENIGQDMYYSYVIAREDGFGILAGQDDAAPDGGTYWLTLMYFHYQNGVWTNTRLVDYTDRNVSSSTEIKVEQHDLFVGSDGRVHLVWRDQGSYYHQVGDGTTWEDAVVLPLRTDLEYTRIMEIDGAIYFLNATNNELFFLREGASEVSVLNYGQEMNCVYMYLAAPGGGTPLSASTYLDLILLSGCSEDWDPTQNFYLRIPKDELAAAAAP